MKDFLLDWLAWVLAMVALGIVIGWGVHFLDRDFERGIERNPERYLDGP